MATNKEIVHQINEAFSRASLDGFLNHCADSISWTIIGKDPIVGKAAISAFMGKMPDVPTMSFEIYNIVADAAMVACNGRMRMPNADGTVYNAAFCDMYRFEDGKVVELNSYVVDLK